MFEILWMRRIHSIHGPRGTDIYVYAYILICIKQKTNSLISLCESTTLLLSLKQNIFNITKDVNCKPSIENMKNDRECYYYFYTCSSSSNLNVNKMY